MICDQYIKSKLEKTNNILEEITKNEQYITPVSIEDKPLFDEFFDKEERHTYGNSWTYVTQGVYGIGQNNLGYKYYDGKNLCMISAYPKIEQPNIIMMYWIRPLGKDMLNIICDYSERIKKKYEISCYVKKLFENQYDFFISKGFKSSKEFPWHTVSHAEDDTYPELIFDRENTLNAIRTSGKRERLGRSFREIVKLSTQNKINISDTDFKKYAFKITNDYFNDYFLTLNKKNYSSIFDYYNMISQNRFTNLLTRKLIYINNVPFGFYILELNKKNNIANLNAMISIKKIYKYLNDYILIHLIETQEVKYINSGGSEDKGIHNFKIKYNPVTENQMYWVTNYFL